MKRNIIYMVGALLSSAILTFSCAEDMPTYSGLAVDKNELFVKIENHTATINVTEGNGNYKVEVADENIATAKVEGDQIIFTAVKNGRTTATITDWSRHSTVVNIRVKEDFNLELDKQELILIKDTNPKESIYVVTGNDNYKVESSDETVATVALVENGKLEITAQEEGLAKIKVTDADGKEAFLDVKVCEYTLAMEELPKETWYPKEVKTIRIKSGNGDYTVESNNSEIASFEQEGENIKITGNIAGDAIITVKDRMGLTFDIPVKVENKLAVDRLTLDWLVVNMNTEVNIMSGSGNYTITPSDNSITCTLSEDKTKITVIGTSQKALQTIKVVDNDWSLELTIKVFIIDNTPFLDYGAKARWYVQGSFVNEIPKSSISTDKGREHLKVAKGTYWGSFANGFHISFEGGRGLGKKTAVSDLYSINGDATESLLHSITDFEIVKREITKPADEKDGKGKFWFRFKEAGREEYSYIITWF